MSEVRRLNEDNPEGDNLVSTNDTNSEKKDTHHPALFFVTEIVLVAGWIPTIIFFFTGVVNGLLLLIEQKEYDR